MSLILSGTDGVSDIDGTAATPAIRGTDANTGIFFPAADTIGFAEGGAEAARFDSSGRFLVGTTTARTIYTGYTPAIQIEGTTASTASMSLVRNSNDAQEPSLFFAKSRGTTNGSNTIVQIGDLLGQLVFNGADGSDTNSIAGTISCNVDGTPGNNDMPGRLTFATTSDGSDTPTERMRIDNSGRVGIGTTSMSSYAPGNLSSALSGDNYITLQAGTSSASGINMVDSATSSAVGLIRYQHASDTMDFFTAGSQRVVITAGGQFLVGTTSESTPAGSTSKIVSQGDFSSVGGEGFGMSVASTTGTGEDHYYISFNTATTTQRGYIYYNNGAGQVQLSATSDARLKENIVDAPSALPVLEQVKVRQYDWKETGSTNIGFVAQELYDVIPRAVAVGQDNEDGTIQRAWGVNNASLVPYLVKAIQELNAKVEAQAAEIAAMRNN